MKTKFTVLLLKVLYWVGAADVKATIVVVPPLPGKPFIHTARRRLK